MRLRTFIGGVESEALDLVYLWDGSDTAYYVNDLILTGTRQPSPTRKIEPGVDILIAVVPRGVARPADHTINGESSGGTVRTEAAWEAVYAPDLTKRLPADVTLTIDVAADVLEDGCPDQPLVLDFVSDPLDKTFLFGSIHFPDLVLDLTLPSGYGLLISSFEGELIDLGWLTSVSADRPLRPISSTFIKPSSVGAVSSAVVRLADSKTSRMPSPVYSINFAAVPYSVIAGTVTDELGPVEGAFVRFYRKEELIDAAVADALGQYSTAVEFIGGDYVAVSFSGTDGRDVVATNFTIPPSERQPSVPLFGP